MRIQQRLLSLTRRLSKWGNRLWPHSHSEASFEAIERLSVVPIHGIDLSLRLDQSDSLELLRQPFELHEVNLMKQALRPGQVVLDVGANIGYYTLLFSRMVGETGAVHAFEPDPMNAEILRRNLADNHCSNVTLHQVAVGNTEESIGLYQCEENTGMHRAYRSICCGRKAVEVRAVILDRALLDVPRIDWIKMDIEGFEYFALQGMDRIIRENAPNLLVEFSPFALAEAGVKTQSFIQFFAERDYMLSSVRETLAPLCYEDLLARAASFDRQAETLLKNTRYKSLKSFGESLVSEFEKMNQPFEILDSWLCQKRSS